MRVSPDAEANTNVVRVNYEGRIFQPVTPPPAQAGDATATDIEAVPGGDVGPDTRFSYHQNGDVVWATYGGGRVQFGTMIATVCSDGTLDARYQQVSSDGLIKTGRCRSTPEFLPDGRVRLHEDWTWTEGDLGTGSSIVEEL